MEKKELKNGYMLLTAPNGVVDTRSGNTYSEAVVKEKDVKYFKEAE